MPASRCDDAQLNDQRRRQAARCRSKIRLISEVTVQIFNLALNNFIKRGEKPFEAPRSFSHLNPSVKVCPQRSVRNFSLAGASSFSPCSRPVSQYCKATLTLCSSLIDYLFHLSFLDRVVIKQMSCCSTGLCHQIAATEG